MASIVRHAGGMTTRRRRMTGIDRFSAVLVELGLEFRGCSDVIAPVMLAVTNFQSLAVASSSFLTASIGPHSVISLKLLTVLVGLGSP